jgi:hypothetical protein
VDIFLTFTCGTVLLIFLILLGEVLLMCIYIQSEAGPLVHFVRPISPLRRFSCILPMYLGCAFNDITLIKNLLHN